MKKHKLAVVIMRAQGATLAHFGLIEKAAELANDVLVILGSTNRSTSTVNPWSFNERKEMIRAGLQGCSYWHVVFKGAKDFLYMDDEWEGSVANTVRTHLRHVAGNDASDKDIVLVGHNKDAPTTAYLESFPKWAKYSVASLGDYNATDLRDLYFKGEDVSRFTKPGVVKWLEQYAKTEGYNYVQQRYIQIAEAKAPYVDLPWGIKFQTSDAYVTCKGHVLLCKRAKGYGEGQWAMPGGYVNQFETSETAIFRELNEETSIDVPPRALRQAYRGQRKFEASDGQQRDERGDFVTYCGVFTLEANTDGSLPKVVPQRSEIDEVRWVPIADLPKYSSRMFLDHEFIIEIVRRAVSINRTL